jgi:conjugative transposon TraM protein
MEKSLQMASKYMPQGQQIPPQDAETSVTSANQPSASQNAGKKTVVTPVVRVDERIVSALAQPMSNDELVRELSKERNLSFYSAGGDAAGQNKNTIRAVIHDNRTITGDMDGQKSVRIRLDEAMNVGGVVIPRNTILTGNASIGQRLEIQITSIEYQGKIFDTEISVYDTDGQRGINVPGSMEASAAKEIAANAGSGMGSSISITQNAGQQVAADLSRGAIQGTSQYLSKKMRQVKIHLKAGHQLLLLPKSMDK